MFCIRLIGPPRHRAYNTPIRYGVRIEDTDDARRSQDRAHELDRGGKLAGLGMRM